MRRFFGLIPFVLIAFTFLIGFPRKAFAIPVGARAGSASGNGVVIQNGTVQIHYEVQTSTSYSTSTTPSTKENSGTGEFIESYATETVIHPDGSISITERILYHFPEPRHGIYRTIPYTKTNESGKRFKMAIEQFRAVDDQNKPYSYDASDDGNAITYKIGDAAKTINGAHWYILRYTVKGALTYFPGHDELYWNAIGTMWKIPILKATATVTMPVPIPSSDIHSSCFVGSAGSTETFCTAFYKNDTVSVQSTRPLGAYEGMTCVIGFPKGTVAILEPTEIVPFFDTNEGKLVLIVLGIIAFAWYVIVPLFVVYKWVVGGRDPKPAMGEVAAWFTPPRTKYKRDLTPAETGTLIDERSDLRDIYASIVDLARRGYLRIIESKKNNFSFEKRKEWESDISLQSHEKILLTGIFKTGPLVTVSTLDISDTFETVKKKIYESLVADQFFPKSPHVIRMQYGLLAVFSFITVNPILLVVSLTFGQFMPKKTLFGAEQAAIARSLKNFLTSQDKQLAFQAKNQMMFEKLLPYAIAFGVEEIWAARFKDLGLTNPDWYVSSGSGRFYSVAFAHSIGSGLNVSFSKSITYHSSKGFSSGFSSGGGFSGGGGGGGGGGSW